MGAALAAQLAVCPAGGRLLAALYAAATGGVAALAALGGGGGGSRGAAALAARLQPHFLCSLANVVRRRYFWAVLTSSFYRPLQDALDVVMAALEVQMATEHLAEREHALGSTRFLAWTAVTMGCANGVFLALMKFLEANGTRRARFFANQGLWPLLSVCMTLRALEMPNVMVKVLGVAEVPSRWYPLSFAIGLSAMRGVMQWDMLASIACGHAFWALSLEDWLVPSRRTAAKFERRWLPQVPALLCRLLGGGWVPAEDPRRLGGFWGADHEEGRAVPPRRQRRPDGEGGGGGGGGGEPTTFRLFGGAGRRLGD